MSLREFEDHLASSEMQRQDVAAIREVAAAVRAQTLGTRPKTPQCLDELDVVEFAAGALDTDRRTALLTHLASCASCRSEVVALSRLTAEPAAGVTSQTTGRRRFAMVGGVIGTAATAAAVAFLLVPRWQQDEKDAHRATVLTLSAPPEAVAPVGPVEAPFQFVWTSVPRADRYLLTLFDETGSILWEVQTADTTAVVPDSVNLVPGAPHYWKAEAETGVDRWVESDLIAFTLMVQPDSSAR